MQQETIDLFLNLTNSSVQQLMTCTGKFGRWPWHDYVHI